jgi:RNA polymerase sigma-70 factor (ECF subfamily)
VTREQEARAASLMRLGQTGDQGAYAALLVLLTEVTRRFVRARVGNALWIDDVVQETLLTVHSARQTYDATRPFAPWFYAIASSRLIDVLRREKRVASREVSSDVLPELASAGETSEETIDVEAIHAAVASLPARQREVIEQLKFEDRSVRDVAGRLQMTESAVKVTAHRGYRVLRRILGDRTRED